MTVIPMHLMQGRSNEQIDHRNRQGNRQGMIGLRGASLDPAAAPDPERRFTPAA